jgi:dimethylargininase
MGRGITTAGLGPPDYEMALRQHEEYVRVLESIGLEVMVLPAAPEFPDAHFVEDTAVVTPGIAVIALPGAGSRQGEEEPIEPILALHRPVARIEPPGTLDGGDVLEAGDTYFIGISQRTNKEGARQLGEALERSGIKWRAVTVGEGLHLKSSASYLGGDTILLNDSMVNAPQFEQYDKIVAAKSEQGAASSLLINDNLFIAEGFPETKAALEARGYSPVELNISEMQKMDGGLTCLSIRL